MAEELAFVERPPTTPIQAKPRKTTGQVITGMSIWRYGAEMSATGIFLAPVRKKPAPEIRLGSARPASSVGKACLAYFERVL